MPENKTLAACKTQHTRNVGHGQHAGGSREAPDGNQGRSGSTLRQSIAIMGGSEFNEGKKMALHGYGLGPILVRIKSKI